MSDTPQPSVIKSPEQVVKTITAKMVNGIWTVELTSNSSVPLIFRDVQSFNRALKLQMVKDRQKARLAPFLKKAEMPATV